MKMRDIMKTMIISDIHGYSKNLKKAIDIFNKTSCERLIVLGDLLRPGPDQEEVKKLLNSMRFCILCMRGNNDSYIYPGELEFNLIDDYLNIRLDSNNVYITHGDRYNRRNCPFLKEGDILIQGHSHTAWMYKENKMFFLNPGSLSLPRDNTDGSYIIYENNKFYLYDLDNNLLKFLEV